ncbi:flavin reductase [Aquicoccus sp. SCR17]|nr:flavin reductase [Carideicomes alvinocaridis]
MPETTEDIDATFQRDFRDAMAALAATACLVTAAEGEARLGRTVTATFSLAVDPPAILVSIKAGSDLATMIRRTGGFSFAMFAEAQRPVAEAFAGQLPAADRFGRGDWLRWSSGHPRLQGAVAAMDCVLAGEMETSGHFLFTGHPQDIALDRHRRPLVWHDRGFNAVHPL